MFSADQVAERLDGLTFAEAAATTVMLGEFDSYSRSAALVFVLYRSPTPADAVRAFLEWGNVCDAPWWHRRHIADCLRGGYSSHWLITWRRPSADSTTRCPPSYGLARMRRAQRARHTLDKRSGCRRRLCGGKALHKQTANARAGANTKAARFRGFRQPTGKRDRSRPSPSSKRFACTLLPACELNPQKPVPVANPSP
jgi:hypothetical protein